MSKLKKIVSILHNYYANNEAFFNSSDVEALLKDHPGAIEELRGLISDLDSQDRPDNLDRAARMISAGYNPSRQELKLAFHRLAKKELKSIAKELMLTEVSVDTNLAGIAVVGETTLMGMAADGVGIYIQISGSSFMRTIKHAKDYSGGRNHSIPSDSFKRSEIIAKAKKLIEQEKERLSA